MKLPRRNSHFYRIVPASRTGQALAPAVSPEGRFHRDSQPTLYVSPRPDWACHDIAAYVRPQDQPRLLDLRAPAPCAAFGIDPALAAIPWLPERGAGLPASTWQVSDRARAPGPTG